MIASVIRSRKEELREACDTMQVAFAKTLVVLLGTLALAPGAMASDAGLFAGSSDVGPVKTPGSVAYDAGRQTYRLTGSGTNMWFGEDEFFFVWKKMTGDFILSADAAFVELAEAWPVRLQL